MTLSAYQDILHRQRPLSRHPKMSVENRAKLFTPFSALRGFDIEILTTEREMCIRDRYVAVHQCFLAQSFFLLNPAFPELCTHYHKVDT